MAYAATAGGTPSDLTAAPGVAALQRALVWLVGASGAIVFIEPSPYELVTVIAAVLFFATGLRLRLVFMPLLLLLVLLNVGYSIAAVPVLDQPDVTSWIATSWYMAVTVMFFAMVVSEDTAARVKAFVEQGGGCRATFFNYRRRLGGGNGTGSAEGKTIIVMGLSRPRLLLCYLTKQGQGLLELAFFQQRHPFCQILRTFFAT